MKSMISNLITALVMFAVAAMPFRLAAQVGNPVEEEQLHYKLVNLGTLGGVLQSNAYGGVNDRGWVTGDANLQGDTNEHAFLWRDGLMTDLGTLGGSNSSTTFKAIAGLIVGNAQTSETDPLGEFWGSAFSCTQVPPFVCDGWQNLIRGFLWQDGQMTALPTLGGNNGAAYGVNNRGQIVGFAENRTQDSSCAHPQDPYPQVLHFEAVVWGPRGEIHELPPFPGDPIKGVPPDVVGEALAINDEGEVVGSSGPCGFPFNFFNPVINAHAVLWRHGRVIDLGSLGGKLNNSAGALNNRGQIVGASDLAGDTSGHAFLWQDGLMTDLGTLAPPLNAFSSANNINKKGQVVGISCDINFNCHGFLWENGVMTDLNTLMPAGSPLQVVWGDNMNDRGEIAVQLYDPSTGYTTAYLMVPDPDSDDPDSHAVHLSVDVSPAVNLPDNVRQLLKQRMRVGPRRSH